MRALTIIFCVTIGLVMTLGTAARAAFLPTDIGGLQLWLDANDLNGNGSPDPSSGTAVSTWVDKSGQGHNATQTSGPNQPLLENSQINGQAVVRFVGLGDSNPDNNFLTTVGYAPFLTSGYTIFIVEQYATLNDGSYISTVNGQTGADGDLIRLLNNGGTPGLRAFSGGGFDDFSGMDGANTPGILTFTNTSVSGGGTGALSAYLDGGSLGSDSVTRSTITHQDMFIGEGGPPVSTGSPPYSGDIAAILIYDSVLNPTQANEVGFYLQTEYGISGDYVVPEPASMGLLLLGVPALLSRRRRVCTDHT